MMNLDPVTLWFYRALLGAVGLACLALAIYALSRAGSETGVRGLDGISGWLSGKKTYLVAAAVPIVLALNAFDYLSDSRTNLALILLGTGGLATLRAGQAKAEKSAATAETAAKVAAVKVEQAVSTVVAKVEAAPVLVAPVVVAAPAATPDLPRVPRERDLT